MSRRIVTHREQVALAAEWRPDLRIAAAPGPFTPTGEVLEGNSSPGVYSDPSGGRWVGKPAKYEFPAQLDAATSRLQNRIGLPAPQTHVVDVNGKPASMQQWISGSPAFPDHNVDISKMDPQDVLELQKHMAFDWAIANHDAHSGNFLRDDATGGLVGIDKGQAFKYFGKDRLSPSFGNDVNPPLRPNKPVYSTMLNQHASGQGQLHDPRTGELGQFIQGIQSIPDDEWREHLRPYADSAHQVGKLSTGDPEAFLDAAVSRKNSLGNDFGNLYDQISARRPQVVASILRQAGVVPGKARTTTGGGTDRTAAKPGWTDAEERWLAEQPQKWQEYYPDNLGAFETDYELAQQPGVLGLTPGEGSLYSLGERVPIYSPTKKNPNPRDLHPAEYGESPRPAVEQTTTPVDQDILPFEEDLPRHNNNPIELWRGGTIDLTHPAAAQLSAYIFGSDDQPTPDAMEKGQMQLYAPDAIDDWDDPRAGDDPYFNIPPDYESPHIGQMALDYLANNPESGSNLGRHWTTDEGVANLFAGNPAFNRATHGEIHLPYRIRAHWPGLGEDPNRTNTGNDYPEEEEITLLPDAPVNVQDFQIWHPYKQDWQSVLSAPQARTANLRTADETSSQMPDMTESLVAGTGLGVGSAAPDAAKNFANSAAGNPYDFGGSGPDSTNAQTGKPATSWDCSGIAGDLTSIYKGQSPSGTATDSTGTRFNTQTDFGKEGFEPGYEAGSFNIGVNPSPGSSGHMVAELPDGTGVESASSKGVQAGDGARSVSDPMFSQQWHMPGTSSDFSMPAAQAAMDGMSAGSNSSKTSAYDPDFEDEVPVSGSRTAGYPPGGYGYWTRREPADCACGELWDKKHHNDFRGKEIRREHGLDQSSPTGTWSSWRSPKHYRVPVDRSGNPREEEVPHPYNTPGERRASLHKTADPIFPNDESDPDFGHDPDDFEESDPGDDPNPTYELYNAWKDAYDSGGAKGKFPDWFDTSEVSDDAYEAFGEWVKHNVDDAEWKEWEDDEHGLAYDNAQQQFHDYLYSNEIPHTQEDAKAKELQELSDEDSGQYTSEGYYIPGAGDYGDPDFEDRPRLFPKNQYDERRYYSPNALNPPSASMARPETNFEEDDPANSIMPWAPEQPMIPLPHEMTDEKGRSHRNGIDIATGGWDRWGEYFTPPKSPAFAEWVKENHGFDPREQSPKARQMFETDHGISTDWDGLAKQWKSQQNPWPKDRKPIDLYRGVRLNLNHPELGDLRRSLFGPRYEDENKTGPTDDRTIARPHPLGFDNPELGHRILDHIEKNYGTRDSGVGRHWSTSHDNATTFATGSGGGAGTGQEYGGPAPNLPVRIRGEWKGLGEDPYRTNTHGHYEDEQEITMLPGAPLNIADVEVRHPQSGQWMSVLGEPHMRTASLQRVAVNSLTPAQQRQQHVENISKYPDSIAVSDWESRPDQSEFSDPVEPPQPTLPGMEGIQGEKGRLLRGLPIDTTRPEFRKVWQMTYGQGQPVDDPGMFEDADLRYEDRGGKFDHPGLADAVLDGLQDSGGAGNHWSADFDIADAYGFGDAPGSQRGMRAWRLMEHLPVLLDADWNGQGEDFRRNNSGNWDQEQEITLQSGAPLTLQELSVPYNAAPWPEGSNEWNPILDKSRDFDITAAFED
jgi:hypothetical protein